MPKFCEMLKAVDFDFQADLGDRWNFRINAEKQRVVVALLLDDLVGHKGKHFAKPLKNWLDGPCVDLYQVDVLAEAWLRLEIELVKRCAATERQLLRKKLVAENRHQATAYQQVLLNIFRQSPWAVSCHSLIAIRLIIDHLPPILRSLVFSISHFGLVSVFVWIAEINQSI